MAQYTYSGDDGRYYPTLRGGTVLNDGDVVELTDKEVPDDGRFTPSKKRADGGKS